MSTFVRNTETQRIVSLAASGTSVEVVGPRFSGRTTVLSRAADALKRIGCAVIIARSVHSASGLEALRFSLPDRIRTHTGFNDFIAINALYEMAKVSKTVILIDDSERLDDRSWAALESVHHEYSVPLVATTTTSQRGDRYRLFNRVSPSCEITLEPISAEQFHDIVESRLGGPASPSLTAQLNMKSAGRPGLALMHLESVIAHGRVRNDRDYWRDNGSLWTNEVSALYASLLAEHPPLVREAAESLAIAGALPLDTARKLIGDHLIEELEERGLVQSFSSGNETYFAVTPPGMGTYLQSLPLSARRTRLTAQVSNELSLQSSRHQCLNTLTTEEKILGQAALEARTPVMEHALLDRYRIAMTEAKRAWEHDPIAPTALEYLRLLLSSRHAEHDVFKIARTPLRYRESDADYQVQFHFLLTRWLLSRGVAPDEAHAQLHAGEDVHSADRQLCLVMAEMEFSGVRHGHEHEILELSKSEGSTTAVSTLALAWFLTLSGKGQDALDALDAATTSQDGLMREAYAYCRGMALIACGQFQYAIAHAERESRYATRTGELSRLASNALIKATASTALGQCNEIHTLMAPVLATSASSSPVAFGNDRAIFSLLALAAVRTNRQFLAATVADQATHTGVQTEALPFSTFEWVDSLTLLQDGDKYAAEAAFKRIEKSARAHGYVLAAETAAMAAYLCNFNLKDVAIFRDRAEAIGGETYRLYIDARAARAQEDGDLLITIAEKLADIGASNEAFRFLTEAKKLFDRLGDSVGNSRTVKATQALKCSTQNTLDENPEGQRIEFTPREREIIAAVSSGKSNTEIASSMYVSVRTIETHIRNIRRKSGITARREMSKLTTFSW